MDSKFFKTIIESLKFNLEPEKILTGPFETTQINQNRKWINPRIIENLPEYCGLYLICLKSNTTIESQAEIRKNIILNNRDFQKNNCIHFEFYNNFSALPSKSELCNLHAFSNNPNSFKVVDIAEKIAEKTAKNRILKIGKADGSKGIRGRIKNYKSMQASITRFVFGTKNVREIEIYCLEVTDTDKIIELEKLAIEQFNLIYSVKPPWEQK